MRYLFHCPHARGGEPTAYIAYNQTPGIAPTPVGVNRVLLRFQQSLFHCPHARGGEPSYGGDNNNDIGIVPTPVGVNRFDLG